MNNNLNIIIVGSDGQLGQSIKSISGKYNNFSFTFANRKQINLTDENNIIDFFINKTFDVIINCAAYTAVDKAETEPDLANKINNLAVQQLAFITKNNNAKLIHISTDYVFSGKKDYPYLETDKVDPECVYGKTKLAGELSIQKTLKKNAIIIRTSWLYSEYGNNFVTKILKLAKENNTLNIICDQIGTPTYAKDLAKTIMDIVKSKTFSQKTFRTNIINFSNEGVSNWYDFAKIILEFKGIKCKVNPVKSKNYHTAAKRPHYSVLSKAKIKKIYNLNVPYWKDSLRKFLNVLGNQV